MSYSACYVLFISENTSSPSEVHLLMLPSQTPGDKGGVAEVMEVSVESVFVSVENLNCLLS